MAQRSISQVQPWTLFSSFEATLAGFRRMASPIDSTSDRRSRSQQIEARSAARSRSRISLRTARAIRRASSSTSSLSQARSDNDADSLSDGRSVGSPRASTSSAVRSTTAVRPCLRALALDRSLPSGGPSAPSI